MMYVCSYQSFCTDRAAEVEEQLREIADKQQINVDKLVELVKENEEILSKMRVRFFVSIPFHVLALAVSISNFICIVLG